MFWAFFAWMAISGDSTRALLPIALAPLLGILIGIMTVPGNWMGRSILKKMQDSDHRLIIDFLTVLMIVNFLYLAAR